MTHSNSANRSGVGWRTVRASVIGPGHVRQRIPNQDSCAVREMADGFSVYAVADGAGSSSRSDDGSAFAALASVEAAQDAFGGPVPATMDDWFNALHFFRRDCLRYFDRSVDIAVRSVLREKPGQSAPAVRASYATTLLAVVARPPYFAYVSIGDCFLVTYRHDGSPHLVVTSADRENLGVTTFLTSPGREPAMTSGIVFDPGIAGIALCTDGLCEGMLTVENSDGKLAFRAPAAFARYFEYFRAPEAREADLGARLESEEFARTSNDDKTIIMAVAPAPVRAPEVRA
ncbi:protein phosphatase 2C domain-containing protein [Nocardia sp. NPDC059240]|uniref:protein phosphatase 2C domain-containing protein n=1 Tax=Nocardia sp. NPDC059240 TaxID=3346786 RepID=UPI00369794F7